jgi:RHS repeat-associated protein
MTASAPTREYIYAGAQLVAKLEGSSTNYFHPDHLSSRAITDSSGTIVEQKGHYPYGETWYPTTNSNKWKFTTYERDGGTNESGNDYAMARTYINRYGRFNSPDPLAGSIADPQSLNRFSYTRNNPVNMVDPFGLWSWCFGVQHGYHETGWLWVEFFLCPNPDPNSRGGNLGGEAAGGQSKSSLGPRLSKAMADCVKELFGLELKAFSASSTGNNGSFTGTTAQGKPLTITNDVNSFTVRDLNVIAYAQPTPPTGRGDTQGITHEGLLATKYFLGIGYAYRNFSLSTNYSGSDLSPAAMLATQIHELGHSLAQILGLAPKNLEDPFAGKLQDCVNQKLAQQAKPQ